MVEEAAAVAARRRCPSATRRVATRTHTRGPIDVDSSSIVKGMGHGGHSDDVIPAFDWVDKNGTPQHYAGMNTDALDVIANGCQILTVTPVAPTVTPSTTCDVQGTYTIPATKGVAYLLDGTPIAAGTYDGPKTATITAQAKPGYLLSDPTWSFSLDLPAAAVCPTQVTPVNPTVVLSPRCDVQGSYTIPTTTGVSYLLDGTPIAAGSHAGPASGTVTAQAGRGIHADPGRLVLRPERPRRGRLPGDRGGGRHPGEPHGRPVGPL